jgi:anti-sigma B factor antagonist
VAYDELDIDITVEQRGKALIYKLGGSLDLATSQSVRAALTGAVEAGMHMLIVDLSGLDFLDSTGLGVLIGAQRRAAERNVQLRFVVVQGPIERLLQITGLARVFAAYRTLDDAFADRAKLPYQP